MSNSKISDECPHCKRPFEIVAVDLSLLRGNAALFVCPDCGMTRPETPDEARRKLRGRRRISVLEVLQSWTPKSPWRRAGLRRSQRVSAPVPLPPARAATTPRQA
jgi:hypothetical protein